MAGSRKSPGIVLQERDRRVLRELDTLRVIDREQARVIAPFGSVTRANTRLLELARAGLLARLPVGTVLGGHKLLYARTPGGAAVVGHAHRQPPWNARSPIVAGQPLLEHLLRTNELYLALRYGNPLFTGCELVEWRTFNLPLQPSGVIPDAYCVLKVRDASRALFVEVDLATEPLRTWSQKADRYVALARSGEFQRQFAREQFGVVVIVPSDRRLQGVRRAIAGRTSKLFWITTFDGARADAIGSAVWWRPTGDAAVVLN
jgi:hypothetical protein